MQIQFNTDHNIEGREALATYADGVVERALGSFSHQITRVEVHLSDESGNKTTPNDKRCVMEARLEGRQPIAVTHEASTVHEAIGGAADKLARRIDHLIGKVRGHESRHADPTPDSPETIVAS